MPPWQAIPEQICGDLARLRSEGDAARLFLMASIATEPQPGKHEARDRSIPPLENGAHLSATEFLRRYETMPEVKKAELIGGIVFNMASPVRHTQHAAPDGLLVTWLGVYAAATQGTELAVNGTLRLGPDDVLQPDSLLLVRPEYGGQTRLDPKGYLQGPPELIVEIAASSASIDTHEKLTAYRRAGVSEYVIWRTEDDAVDWRWLEEDEYRLLAPDAGGILRSRGFPGLHLSVPALLAGDFGLLLDTLKSGLASAEHAEFVRLLESRRA